ncbi:MAG: methyltransferase domain-containing protein [Planctomycetota bacterium]
MAIERIHEGYVKSRRVAVLSKHFADLLPDEGEVLDIGAGDGELAAAILEHKPGLTFRGLETLVRDDTAIPIEPFDGQSIPLGDNATDYALFSDVLHHTEDPMVLLREAVRVARKGVLIKDHLVQGLLARPTLRFMDNIGNRRFGVVLPHNYWTPKQWDTAYQALGLEREAFITRLGLYPLWANWCFGRGLHFVIRLGVH